MGNRVNKIVKRIYYAVEISLRSPLAVSSGERGITDMDVLRNQKGEVFIPGTSIAGAFRDYLQKNKEENCSFGFSKGEEGRMSSICISDIYFEKNPVAAARDGVQLSDEKQVRNKFDMEIIETGASGILYFHYTIREENQTADADLEAACLFCGMEQGEIRFGAHKTRGFGRIAVGNIHRAEFDAGHVEKWISFNRKVLFSYPLKKEYKEWIKEHQTDERKYYVIHVPLKLTGGISIRKYSAEPMKADFEHITCNGEPVIPGSSWNGAIRADVKNILRQLGCKAGRSSFLIDQWFGYVEVKEGQDTGKSVKKKVNAQKSSVVIEESIIHHSVHVPMTRNKISRFDASTITGALYSEITCCGGETELEIMVRKDGGRWYYALLAVLELAVQDICKGYVSVGGQAAIGRGIFSGPSEGFLDERIRKRGQQELLYLVDGKEDE